MDDKKIELLDLLQGILFDHPEGIKEYDLLMILKEMELPVFHCSRFPGSLALFRSHFMLFHLLYDLRERLYQEQKGDIEIHCLKIILRPWQGPEQTLPGRPDSLRQYYLNIANMDEMNEVDLEKMISRFWEDYLKFDKRPESLNILGLDHNATQTEIKRRYRELALRHHPDRNGAPEEFRKINEAARVLL